MGRQRWPDEKSAKAFSLRLDGLSFGEIAEAMGLTRSAVSGHLARHGVSGWDDTSAPIIRRREPAPQVDRYNRRGTYSFEVPTRRQNDDHKHLTLLLSSLREQAPA